MLLNCSCFYYACKTKAKNKQQKRENVNGCRTPPFFAASLICLLSFVISCFRWWSRLQQLVSYEGVRATPAPSSSSSQTRTSRYIFSTISYCFAIINIATLRIQTHIIGARFFSATHVASSQTHQLHANTHSHSHAQTRAHSN